MEKHDKQFAMELVEQARRLGLMRTRGSTQCSNCQAVFPNEYFFCPKCNTEPSIENLQIEFEF